MLKKLLLAVLAILIAVAPLTACTKPNDPTDPEEPPVICVVTFVTDDGSIEKEVEMGKALTDIPALPTDAGYTVAWSITDFSCVQTNLTVTLIKTAESYTITYDLEGLEDEIEIAKTSESVTFGETFALQEPTRPAYIFMGWVNAQGQNVAKNGTWNIDVGANGAELVLKAVWADDGNWSDRA